jgi:hypothetical protein
MTAHTVQYQSEPRTVMAMWAWALLTASSVSEVRIVSAYHQTVAKHTIDLKSLVTHIVGIPGFKDLERLVCSVRCVREDGAGILLRRREGI